MSGSYCQNMQRRLLETAEEDLEMAEHEHLRLCPTCRAFARDVAASGALMTAIAEESPLPELSRDLKTRVLADIMDKLSTDNGHRAQIIDLKTSRRDSSAPQKRFWRGWAAAAVLMVCIGAGLLHIQSGRSIGRLEFACGPTSLRTGAPARRHEGLGQWACRSGSVLSTDASSSAIFTVGEAVRAAMDRGTTLQICDRETLDLRQGSVWLSVTPGGRGFKVKTPYAEVQVTGTHFGVTVSDRETRVDVASGSVNIIQAQARDKVTGGLAMAAGPQGIAPATPRKEGTNLPGWYNDLLKAEKIASAGKYLPSIGKR